MAKTRNQIRAAELEKSIHAEVFENEDFNRHLQETATKLELPLDVVEAVMKNKILQMPKIIYSEKRLLKIITVFGFFKINIKPDKLNRNIKNKLL